MTTEMTQLTINAGQYSEKGIKKQNEDACGIRIPDEAQLINKGIAIAIADGVSSADYGREAAEACVTGFLSDYYSTADSWTVKNSGQKVLGAINRWLYGQGQSALSGQGMLTTFCGLILKSTTAHLFHVGDSRIYRLRDGDLEQLTRDHQTWGGAEKAFLSRAMGADSGVEIDYRSEPLEEGDLFFLSTDGVHDFISHKELKQLLTELRGHPERAARTLVTRALEQGSHDNVTCQVLDITALPCQNQQEFYQHLTELPFPPALESGMILEGYRILRELHASNRSQVYLAQDEESGEQVVIKTPSVNFEDDAEYIDGFLNEEWAGKRINSNHVLKIIEPKKPRRFLYYVSEFIDGQNLRQWMNDNPEPVLDEVRRIMEQACAGIRNFHRLEMLHQDLKPENIMINKDGVVKIIDFGSTRIAGIQEIASPIERGNLLGTYDYAAPEYFINQPGSNRSDIYSLGAISYEMLTGQLPYGGALSVRALKRASYHPAHEINKNIPRWMDAALEKACMIKPQRRYQLLSEFTHDLCHPNTSLQSKEFQPLLKRNPLGFWRGSALLLLVINLLLVYQLLK